MSPPSCSALEYHTGAGCANDRSNLDPARRLADDTLMRVTFLGTGTSHGIPQIGCDCPVCRSADPRNHRLRPSLLVEDQTTTALVDATPDFRAQALRAGLKRLDAVVLTHAHADHVLGLDDLRVFTTGRRLPVFGSAETLSAVARMFPYACVEKPAWQGLPWFATQPVAAGESFPIGGLTCRAVALVHGRMTVFGYVFDNAVAYLTDCNIVPAEAIESLRGIPVLIIDALRHRPHVTHLTVAEALAVRDRVKPRLTLFTHICHELDHATTASQLPAGVTMAYDGLQLEVADGACRLLE